MNYFNVNIILELITVRVKVSKVIALTLFGIVFFYSMTLQSFAAAICTFSPTEDCSISISLSPAASTVASGGNTNVTATVTGLLQWGSVTISQSDFTGISTPSPSLGGPSNNKVTTGNTGEITARHTVTAFVENTELETGSDTIYIDIAPVVNIQFSFMEKVRQFFGAKISERANIFALEK